MKEKTQCKGKTLTGNQCFDTARRSGYCNTHNPKRVRKRLLRVIARLNGQLEIAQQRLKLIDTLPNSGKEEE